MNPRIRSNRKKLLIASAGASAGVIIAFSMIYLFTPIGAAEQVRGYQLANWNTTRSSIVSDIIVIGQVTSVENVVIDEFFNFTHPETGELVSDPRTNLYYRVTIAAERYLKDSTGETSPVLVFRDPTVQGIFFVDGMKVNVISENPSKYSVGERAVFFLTLTPDEDSLQMAGITSKFTINETDNTLQSTQLERQGKPPMKLADLEEKISAALDRTN